MKTKPLPQVANGGPRGSDDLRAYLPPFHDQYDLCPGSNVASDGSDWDNFPTADKAEGWLIPTVKGIHWLCKKNSTNTLCLNHC